MPGNADSSDHTLVSGADRLGGLFFVNVFGQPIRVTPRPFTADLESANMRHAFNPALRRSQTRVLSKLNFDRRPMFRRRSRGQR